MKYKCDIEGCEFECEHELDLIEHFNKSHKDELTDYCINWMKSIGLTPIETCKCCGKKIEVNKIKYRIPSMDPLSDSIIKLKLGYCSNNCLTKCIEDLIWKYEPWQGTHLQCLYERRNVWIKHPNPEGRPLSEEHKWKISKSVKNAIKEGRLDPILNRTDSIIIHRPVGIKTSWLKYSKEYLRSKSSYDEKLFSNKLNLINLNYKTQVYFDLGSKYKFLDYFMFYKYHKINIEIDGDNCHKIYNDLEKDKLLYDKYEVLTLRINNEASRFITGDQIKDSLDKLIKDGPYWITCKTDKDIYDWKWLVRYGYFKSCKTVLSSG